MNWLIRLGDKTGSIGSVVSAMGCAICFPAIANIGAAIGLGFLSQWESLFLDVLLPFFACLTLLINLLGWFSHKQWHRTIIGVVGPILLLLSFYPWFQYGWSTYVTYSALALMLVVSGCDLVSPANKHCSGKACASGAAK
ncbi:MAG TPA: mercury transporter MerC [Colwellia sp.]|nr:mercury transporter MerC [Colwellia sp.]|tara:strand:- start:6894 stop:7313 length:420 start_codon:yes stop_codon:yes gene_type:complete